MKMTNLPNTFHVHGGLEWAVCFRAAYGSAIIIGAALLLICCSDPEAKARKLLDQAQVLERAGKEQEAQQLLDEVVKGYPQTTAATTANEAPQQKKSAKESSLFRRCCKRSRGACQDEDNWQCPTDTSVHQWEIHIFGGAGR